MKLNRNKGITLIALIITIIILLILAEISISALTQTGLFSRAKQAEQLSKEKQEEENATLGTYENEIDKYLDKNSGETPNEPEEIKLIDKVKDGTIKIGDYVKYTPDTVTSTDKSYTDLLSNLTTYSGNTDSTKNTSSTLTQEKLNWRVLDVTDDGHVRLISELPTTSTIALGGYNGYNNAVKLLDDTCSTLYTNKQLSSKVQNIKIEDIQNKMEEKDYSKFEENGDYGKRFTPENKYYPNILLKEKEQTVTIGTNKTTGTELDLNEQKVLQNQTEKLQANTLDVKYTYWDKEITINDLNGENKEMYYKLFIKNEGYYNTYWMSSRCASANAYYARFHVRYVNNGSILAYYLYDSGDFTDSRNYAFRPIITLNSNVQIDTANSGNGSTAAQGYAIK